MLNLIFAADAHSHNLIRGITDGFTFVIDAVWNHLEHFNAAPYYNLGFIIGLLLLLFLAVWLPLERLLIVLVIVLLVYVIANN